MLDRRGARANRADEDRREFPLAHSQIWRHVFFAPIRPGLNSDIKAGDIVFCHVVPRTYYFVHLVWCVKKTLVNGVWKDTFWVGNNKDGDARLCNGRTYREFIYGILAKNAPVAFVARRVSIEPPEHLKYQHDCMKGCNSHRNSTGCNSHCCNVQPFRTIFAAPACIARRSLASVVERKM